MQRWTPPALPAKGRLSRALSRSLGQTYAKVGPSLRKLFSEAFQCYCSLPEAVPWIWSAVTHIEGTVCQSVTLVSLRMIARAGVIGEQCGLSQSKYRNTKVQKNCNQNSNFIFYFF